MTAHRKRRVAADEAHSWARNLRLRNPYAKLVLCMLTLYVQGDGICFAGVKALSEDCELAEETIRRRLTWLEGVGAITRFPQWLDENGRRNGEGRGKRTTDEIRLMIDADPELIEARATGDDDGNSGADGGEISPPPGTGLNPGAEAVSPPPSPLAAPSLRRGSDSFEPEPEPKKDSPPTPQAGGGGSSVEQPSEAKQAFPGSETWPTFEVAYSEPITRQSIARQVWSALTEAERVQAITAARGYVAWRRSQKKPPNALNAHTFLRERDAWPGFVKLAPAEPQARIFIAEQSADFDALRVLALIRGTPPPDARFDVEHATKGIWRHGIVPLDLASLTQFSNKPIEQWGHAEEKTKPFFAWSDRIHKWTGHRVEPRRIETGGEHEFTWNGKTTMVKNFVMGLRVPCLFPPRKDGSIGPDPLSDSEAQEFLDTG